LGYDLNMVLVGGLLDYGLLVGGLQTFALQSSKEIIVPHPS